MTEEPYCYVPEDEEEDSCPYANSEFCFHCKYYHDPCFPEFDEE